MKAGVQPSTFTWNKLLSGQQQQQQQQAGPAPDLRAQLQPFQDYSPQQIQEQLQKLHIQQHSDIPDTNTISDEFQFVLASIASTSSSSNSGDGTGNTDPIQSIAPSSSSGSTTSVASRKSSGSSLIAQLLSPSPPQPAVPIQSPKTHGAATSSNSVLYGHSPPGTELLHQPTTGRRHSFQDTVSTVSHPRQHRYMYMYVYVRACEAVITTNFLSVQIHPTRALPCQPPPKPHSTSSSSKHQPPFIADAFISCQCRSES